MVEEFRSIAGARANRLIRSHTGCDKFLPFFLQRKAGEDTGLDGVRPEQQVCPAIVESLHDRAIQRTRFWTKPWIIGIEGIGLLVSLNDPRRHQAELLKPDRIRSDNVVHSRQSRTVPHVCRFCRSDEGGEFFQVRLLH